MQQKAKVINIQEIVLEKRKRGFVRWHLHRGWGSLPIPSFLVHSKTFEISAVFLWQTSNSKR
jgi:hypothetical protein